MELKELITEGESFLMNVRRGNFADYIADDKGYTEWATKSLMFLQSSYPTHPQTERFDFFVKKHMVTPDECSQLIAILKAFYEINPKIADVDYEKVLSVIFDKP